jgi:hypothetical protein
MARKGRPIIECWRRLPSGRIEHRAYRTARASSMFDDPERLFKTRVIAVMLRVIGREQDTYGERKTRTTGTWRRAGKVKKGVTLAQLRESLLKRGFTFGAPPRSEIEKIPVSSLDT